MILVDTSVWVSYLKKDDLDTRDILLKYLEKGHVFTFSAIFGELFQGVINNKEREVIQIIWETLPKVDEYELFIRAGNMSSRYKLYNQGVGLIDSCLLVACLENNLALWTLDKKLQRAYDLITKEPYNLSLEANF